MTSMIERVARNAYFDHVDQHGYPNGLPTWDELPERIERRIDLYTREHWRSIATAMLHAAREPTEDMIEAGSCQLGAYYPPDQAENVWQAMLDTAANPTP